jgi:transposase
MNGARVGDLFMSLIHTCELNRVNPFDYLAEVLRHPAEITMRPAEWMPWNYRTTLAGIAILTAA